MPVILNSFYGGNSHWFYSQSFMGGMWKHARGGNGDWTVLKPDGQYLDKEIGPGWTKWERLSRSERSPGFFKLTPLTAVPEGAPPEPPPGTLIVRLRQRNLTRGARGDLARLTAADVKRWESHGLRWDLRYNDSFFDVMWLSKAEWTSLIPEHPQKNETFPLPSAMKKRLLLWHLTNRTFCVGDAWHEDDIRSEDLTLRVEQVVPFIRLRLQGRFALKMDGSPDDVKKDWHRTEHGYEGRILGFIDYDPVQKAITLFDLVAIGDYWGGDSEGGRHSEVGRLPLGISFELAQGESIQDRILPCAGVNLAQYLQLK